MYVIRSIIVLLVLSISLNKAKLIVKDNYDSCFQANLLETSTKTSSSSTSCLFQYSSIYVEYIFKLNVNETSRLEFIDYNTIGTSDYGVIKSDLYVGAILAIIRSTSDTNDFNVGQQSTIQNDNKFRVEKLFKNIFLVKLNTKVNVINDEIDDLSLNLNLTILNSQQLSTNLLLKFKQIANDNFKLRFDSYKVNLNIIEHNSHQLQSFNSIYLYKANAYIANNLSNLVDSSSIRYAIYSDSSSGWFDIDVVNGHIFTKNGINIDRERVNTIYLNISATINNKLFEPNYQQIIVNLIDVNDNVPSYKQAEYLLTLDATQLLANGSTSIRIFNEKAIDLDATQPNSIVDYSILELMQPKDDQQLMLQFKMNETNGELWMNTAIIDKVIDSTTPSLFVTLKIMCKDRGQTPESLSNYTLLKIKLVQKIQQNYPIKLYFNAKISEIDNGTIIGCMKSYWPETSTSISSINSLIDNVTVINNFNLTIDTNGCVSVLLSEKLINKKINFIISYFKPQQQTPNKMIIVLIYDTQNELNNNNNNNFNIDEDYQYEIWGGNKRLIGHLTIDNCTNIVDYQLINGNKMARFEIVNNNVQNSNVLTLYSIKQLDYELRQFYDLELIVYCVNDNNDGVIVKRSNIGVYVNDINDNNPIFLNSHLINNSKISVYLDYNQDDKNEGGNNNVTLNIVEIKAIDYDLSENYSLINYLFDYYTNETEQEKSIIFKYNQTNGKFSYYLNKTNLFMNTLNTKTIQDTIDYTFQLTAYNPLYLDNKTTILFYLRVYLRNLKQIIKQNYFQIETTTTNKYFNSKYYYSYLNQIQIEQFNIDQCYVNYIEIDDFNYKYYINKIENNSSMVFISILNNYMMSSSLNDNYYELHQLKINCRLIESVQTTNIGLLNTYLNVKLFYKLDKGRLIDQQQQQQQQQLNCIFIYVTNLKTIFNNNNNNDLIQINPYHHLNVKLNEFNGDNVIYLYYLSSTKNADIVANLFEFDHLNGILYVKNLTQFRAINQSLIDVYYDVYLIDNMNIVGLMRGLCIKIQFIDINTYNQIDNCLSKYDAKVFSVNVVSNVTQLTQFKCGLNLSYKIINIKKVYFNGDNDDLTTLNRRFTVDSNGTLYFSSNSSSNLIEFYQLKIEGCNYKMLDDENNNYCRTFNYITQINYQISLAFNQTSVNIDINDQNTPQFSSLLYLNDFLLVNKLKMTSTIKLKLNYKIINGNNGSEFYIKPSTNQLINLKRFNSTVKSSYSLQISVSCCNQSSITTSIIINFNIKSSLPVRIVQTTLDLDEIIQLTNPINLLKLNNLTIKQLICINIDQIKCENIFDVGNNYLTANRNSLIAYRQLYTDDNIQLNIKIFNSNAYYRFIHVPKIDIEYDFEIKTSIGFIKTNTNGDQTAQFQLDFNVNDDSTTVSVFGIRNLITNSDVFGLDYKLYQLQGNYYLKLNDISLFELNQIYEFTFVLNPTTLKQQFNVIRTNLNENSNAIVNNFYSFYETDIQNGQLLFDLNDNSLNNKIYLIENVTGSVDNTQQINLRKYFRIDANSGKVYLNGLPNLDRETVGSLVKFNIEAFIINNQTMSTYRIVMYQIDLEVVDRNDNPPRCDVYYKNLTLFKSQLLINTQLTAIKRSSVVIYKMNSTDYDVSDKLLYSIDYTTTDSYLPFQIDKYTGELEYMLIDDDDNYTNGFKYYQIKVLVSDYLNQIVSLIDVYLIDNSPLANITQKMKFYFDVNDNIEQDSVVGFFNISYKNVTYDIISDINQFYIDSNAQVLRTKYNLTSNDNDVYVIELKIRDRSVQNKLLILASVFINVNIDKVSLSNIQTVNYYINSSDLIGNNLSFNQSSYNKRLNYVIVYETSDNTCDINQYNGSISCKNDRLLQMNGKYGLILFQFDIQNRQYVSILYMNIFVNQINDQSQLVTNRTIETFNEIVKSKYLTISNLTLKLNEDMLIGSEITAFSTNQSFNRRFLFSEQTDDEVFFNLNKYNGKLLLKNSMNYEYKSEMSIIVNVFDLVTDVVTGYYNLQLSQIINLNISVVKVVKKKPQFPYNSYKFSINKRDLVDDQLMIGTINAFVNELNPQLFYYLQANDDSNDFNNLARIYDAVDASEAQQAIQNRRKQQQSVDARIANKDETDDSLFTIDPFSAQLTLSSSNYKDITKSLYVFYVVAQYTASLSASVECEIEFYTEFIDQYTNIYTNVMQLELNGDVNTIVGSFLFDFNQFLLKNTGNNAFTYELKSTESPFIIDQLNGKLYLGENLRNTTYQFDVVINNITKISCIFNTLASKLQFENSIYNLNLSTNYFFTENRLITLKVKQTNKNNIKYYIANNSIIFQKMFQLNQDTGELSTIVSNLADFNYIFSSDINAFMNVMAIDQTNNATATTIVRFNITYSITNDTSQLQNPQFKRLYTADVYENSAIGTFVLLIEIDWPSQMNKSDVQFYFYNSITRYSNISETGEFSINSSTGKIYVNKQIDREAKDMYVVKVYAVVKNLVLQTTIPIYVEDINDNRPLFNDIVSTINQTLNIELDFEYLFGLNTSSVSVYRFNASDADSNLNGKVFYMCESMRNDLFSIDPLNGWLNISVNHSDIDTYTDYTHKFSVIAYDKGVPSLKSDKIWVSIRIRKSYNNEFESKVYIPYNQSVNTSIYSLKIDYPYTYKYLIVDNSKLLCNDCFIYDQTTGNLMLMKQFQMNQRYEIAFKLTLNSVYTFKKLNITVTDINTQTPVFLSPSINQLSINITQNTQIQTVIYQFVASDDDKTEPNNVVQYKINNNDRELMYFQIDRNSGKLTVSNNLTNSDRFLFSFKVFATDSATINTKISNEIAVNVLVYDRLLDLIQFTNTFYEFYVYKNSNKNPIGTIGLSVNYSYIEEIKYINSFQIDSTKIVWSKCIEEMYQRITIDCTSQFMFNKTNKSINIYENNPQDQQCMYCNKFEVNLQVTIKLQDLIKQLQTTIRVYKSPLENTNKKIFTEDYYQVTLASNAATFSYLNFLNDDIKQLNKSLFTYKLIQIINKTQTVSYNLNEEEQSITIVNGTSMPVEHYKFQLFAFLVDQTGQYMNKDSCLISVIWLNNLFNSSQYAYFKQSYWYFELNSSQIADLNNQLNYNSNSINTIVCNLNDILITSNQTNSFSVELDMQPNILETTTSEYQTIYNQLFQLDRTNSSIKLANDPILSRIRFINQIHIANVQVCTNDGKQCDRAVIYIKLNFIFDNQQTIENYYEIDENRKVEIDRKSLLSIPIYKLARFNAKDYSNYEIINDDSNYFRIDPQTGLIYSNSYLFRTSEFNKNTSTNNTVLNLNIMINKIRYLFNIEIFLIERFQNPLSNISENLMIEFYASTRSSLTNSLLNYYYLANFAKSADISCNLVDDSSNNSSIIVSNNCYVYTRQLQLNDNMPTYKIRVSNNGITKSIYTYINLKIINDVTPNRRILIKQQQQQQQQQQPFLILYTNQTNSQITSGFNNYLNTKFNAIIYSYESIGELNRLIIKYDTNYNSQQVNLINKIYSNLLDIKTQFKIEIITIKTIADFDNCTYCSSLSSSVCLNQVDIASYRPLVAYNYQQVINTKNYVLNAPKIEIRKYCVNNCIDNEQRINQQFNDKLLFYKLNYLVYEYLYLYKYMFISFLFKSNSTTISNQFLFYAKFINNNQFFDCEITDSQLTFKFNLNNDFNNQTSQTVRLDKLLDPFVWYKIETLIVNQSINIQLSEWSVNDGMFTSCSPTDCKISLQLPNRIEFNNDQLKLYIGGLNELDLISAQNLIGNYYSDNLYMAEFRVNSFNLFKQNEMTQYATKRQLFDENQHLIDTCSNEYNYCAENIWSSNCDLALSSLQMNNREENQTLVTFVMKQYYQDYLNFANNILTNDSFELMLNLKFTIVLNEKQTNNAVLIRTPNTILYIDFLQSTLNLMYKQEIVVNIPFKYSLNSNPYTIQLKQTNNDIELRLNDNNNFVTSAFVDIFFSKKVSIESNKLNNSNRLCLIELSINGYRIPLINGYSIQYDTYSIDNLTDETTNNWCAIIRTTPIISTITRTSTAATATQAASNFLYPWGIIIVVCVGVLLMLFGLFIIVFSLYKRRRLNCIKSLKSSKCSTFNSRNGLLFITSQLSTSSASSTISDGGGGVGIGNNAELSTPNQANIEDHKKLPKRYDQNEIQFDQINGMNSRIFAKLGPVNQNNERFSTTTDDQIIIPTPSTHVPSKYKLPSQSISSNSSLILSTNDELNDDQMNTTTTDSIHTFGSNADMNLENAFLSVDFSELKETLNWTPSYELYKDVFEDLSNLSIDYLNQPTNHANQINTNNYYHDTEFDGYNNEEFVDSNEYTLREDAYINDQDELNGNAQQQQQQQQQRDIQTFIISEFDINNIQTFV